jgi:hypothetical protein
MTDQLFTEDQLNQLRVEFAAINRIDPCLPTVDEPVNFAAGDVD